MLADTWAAEEGEKFVIFSRHYTFAGPTRHFDSGAIATIVKGLRNHNVFKYHDGSLSGISIDCRKATPLDLLAECATGESD